MRSQEEPGGARRGHEEEPGGFRSQEEPGEARRSQEESGSARRTQDGPGCAPNVWKTNRNLKDVVKDVPKWYQETVCR